MGNHQKLRIGVKVNAEVYSCQGRISDDKTHTGSTLSCSDSLYCKNCKNPTQLPASGLVLTPIKVFLYVQSFQVGCSADDH